MIERSRRRRAVKSTWWASVIAGFYIIWNLWIRPLMLPPNVAVIPVTVVDWVIMMAVLVPGLYWLDARYDAIARGEQWFYNRLEASGE